MLNRATTRYIAYLITYTALLLFVVYKLELIFSFFGVVFKVLTPLFFGGVVAFVVSTPFERLTEFFDRWRVLKKHSLSAPVAFVVLYVTLSVGIALIFGYLLPSLYRSVSAILDNMDGYMASLNSVFSELMSMLGFHSVDSDVVSSLTMQVAVMVNAFFDDVSANFVEYTGRIVPYMFGVLLGLILSAYLLKERKHLTSQLTSLGEAYLTPSLFERVCRLATVVHEAFSDFVMGQVTESVILGTLCFGGMTVFGFPFALPISFIVGLTNIIPIVGPFIGAVPALLLIVAESPEEALWFLIFIVLLQQFESNIIYPRVVGNRVGLPGLWVIIAVLLGGGLFGVLGMFVAVPAMSVLYRIVKEDVKARREGE